MRFGMVHRVMTDALAALGVLALVASGQFSRAVSVILLVGLALALLVRESWQRHPAFRHVDTIALLAVIAIQIGRIAFDASFIDVLVEFAAALQIIRLATRKGAAHDQQVIVLALLHLIAGTVLGGGLGYGLCFVGVLVVAPGALVLSHLRREVEGNYRQGARDRTGLPVDVPRILRSRRVVGRSFLAVTCLLAIPILVFTAALFVVFPRVGLSLLLFNRPHAGRFIGFSGHVDLGDVGVLRQDSSLAMRVTIPGLPDPPPARIALHLRGTALDQYNGRSWSQSDPSKTSRPKPDLQGLYALEGDTTTVRADARRLEIDLEPIDPPVIFVPPNGAAVRLRSKNQVGDLATTVQAGAEGELRYQALDDRGLKYDVLLTPHDEPAFRTPLADRERYLQLPDMPDRIRDLASKWTAGAATDEAKARAIESHLRTEFKYDLGSPSGRASQPLDDFLFESKRGHCEYYSTAMAVMLRIVNVPTRNVTGFIGGSYNRFSKYYSVRNGDAHSWVEAYIDGKGWLTFDPTPPADAEPKSELTGAWAVVRDFLEASSQRWERHVVGYDLQQQISLWNTVASRYGKRNDGASIPRWKLVVVVCGVAGLVAGYVWLVRRRRRRANPRSTRRDGPRSPSAILATALYEQLETAMAAQGVPRPPGLPPLRHARDLARGGHALSDEILELTQIYVAARFGGAAIDEETKRDYEKRVRAVRLADLRSRAAALRA